LLVACGGQDDTASVQATMQSRWWAWAAAERHGTDPVSDSTGEDCGRNQPTDMWFFAGTFGGEVTRRCSVPSGRPVVVPAVNYYTTEGDCDEIMRAASGSVELDGVARQLDRIEAEPVEFEGVAGNAVSNGRERIRATGCGLWARIPDLSSGTHQLRIRGRFGEISVGVDYVLDVGPASSANVPTS
jgi:hypothetical protein